MGLDQLRAILTEHFDDEKSFNLILSVLSDKLEVTKRDERRAFIRIFSILTEDNNRITIHLPRIIILLQTLVIDENSKYFNIISETFGIYLVISR